MGFACSAAKSTRRLIARAATGSPNSFLCTNKEYGDFVLRFEAKVDNELNSGVQIRSKTKEPTKEGETFGRVYGPQVEIEASGEKGAEAGYVYGEATDRGWLTPPERLVPHKHFKDGHWNRFRVVAKGPRIRTFINGQKIADLTDEEIYKTQPFLSPLRLKPPGLKLPRKPEHPTRLQAIKRPYTTG